MKAKISKKEQKKTIGETVDDKMARRRKSILAKAYKNEKGVEVSGKRRQNKNNEEEVATWSRNRWTKRKTGTTTILYRI